jgi:tRNA pseudouridine55 synthase
VKSKSAAEVHPGFFNILKPVGITSHDVVARVRRITGIKQVGHAGTLDPLASGVMVVACGKACRLLRFLADDKTYLAEILLGVQTETDDMEGAIIEEKALSEDLNETRVKDAISAFVGDITQIPPIYSAIQVKGERLYSLARSGADLAALGIEIPSRNVNVAEISVEAITLPVVAARITCSKGTYIRSIARDLGASLGCGGTLKSLVRERSGTFPISEAITLEKLAELQGEDSARAAMVPVEKALPIKQIFLSTAEIGKLTLGQKISTAIPANCENCVADDFLLVRHEDGQAVLVAQLKTIEACLFHLSPEVVFSNVQQHV